VVIRSKHLPYIAIPVSAISILLLMFFLGSNNYDGNLSLIGRSDDNNIASDNQKISDGQTKGQSEIDDYSIRGAVSSTSGENKYWKNIKPISVGHPLRRGSILFKNIPCPFHVLYL
jgi:hypothetical protein